MIFFIEKENDEVFNLLGPRVDWNVIIPWWLLSFFFLFIVINGVAPARAMTLFGTYSNLALFLLLS